jgi:hypothetical protein
MSLVLLLLQMAGQQQVTLDHAVSTQQPHSSLP